MSPPESKPLDSFTTPEKPCTMSSSSSSSQIHPMDVQSIKPSSTPERTAAKVLLSPPISPWTKNQHEIDETKSKGLVKAHNAEIIRDPVLYPDQDEEKEVILAPLLFPTSPAQKYAEQLVNDHMASTAGHLNEKVGRPTREEYLLALSCVSNLGRKYNSDPKAYLKRARDEMDELYSQSKRLCAAPGVSWKQKIPLTFAPATKQPRKIAAAPKQPKQPKVPKPKVIRRTPKPSPKQALLNYPDAGRGATPEGRAPGMKRPEDIDYNSLLDYCPPLSTLPTGNPKALKTDWASNNPLNLTNDPDRHMLHEAEVILASTLRLTCATYLCSKRRIFEGRLKAYKNGKEFRKTDAQQACKIDVNKASKLWTVYDKVGWFNKSYFEQYL